MQNRNNAVALPRFMRVPAAVAWSGLSRSRIYELMREGRISARKDASTTLLEVGSIVDYLESLPPAKFCNPQKCAA